ncbi:MAG: thioredoxin family protein [Candidatus Rifleibacteriota bacterium]
MNKILSVIFLLLFSMTAFAQVASLTNDVDNKKLPRMVDFGSKQCKACKAMEPVLETCKDKYSDKFKTEFVDVWQPENQTFAKTHQIKSIPTQVFFNEEGKELFRNTGFISEEEILAKWAELGFDFEKQNDKD